MIVVQYNVCPYSGPWDHTKFHSMFALVRAGERHVKGIPNRKLTSVWLSRPSKHLEPFQLELIY